jgi:hypothetical protein
MGTKKIIGLIVSTVIILYVANIVYGFYKLGRSFSQLEIVEAPLDYTRLFNPESLKSFEHITTYSQGDAFPVSRYRYKQRDLVVCSFQLSDNVTVLGDVLTVNDKLNSPSLNGPYTNILKVKSKYDFAFENAGDTITQLKIFLPKVSVINRYNNDSAVYFYSELNGITIHLSMHEFATINISENQYQNNEPKFHEMVFLKKMNKIFVIYLLTSNDVEQLLPSLLQGDISNEGIE